MYKSIYPQIQYTYNNMIYVSTRQNLLTELSFATNLISNNMSMRALGPNLEDFGPKLEENKPFEFLKKNVSFVFHRPSTVLLFY